VLEHQNSTSLLGDVNLTKDAQALITHCSGLTHPDCIQVDANYTNNPLLKHGMHQTKNHQGAGTGPKVMHRCARSQMKI
jgi:hypothetical protein